MMCTRCQEITMRASEKKCVQRSIKMVREKKKNHRIISSEKDPLQNYNKAFKYTMRLQANDGISTNSILGLNDSTFFFSHFFFFHKRIRYALCESFMFLLLFHYSKHYVLMCSVLSLCVTFQGKFNKASALLFQLLLLLLLLFKIVKI